TGDCLDRYKGKAGSSDRSLPCLSAPGGGWTVFQRRRDGSVSFNRGWSEYRDGFGEPRGEHWLGNQHIHFLTNQGPYSLRIDLQDWSHAHRHALYQSFRIDSEEDGYRLHVSGFSGTVEDSFGWYHDQHSFSTPDTGNICAEISHAGWWFHQCFYANLNGFYYKVDVTSANTSRDPCSLKNIKESKWGCLFSNFMIKLE
uniref:Si:ch211-203k16.3 n=1 Tax=Oryzias sinensis TaxID=183150 RepID=A0A8C7Y7R6_9TELE